MPRPQSVAIVCWVIIVQGVFGLVGVLSAFLGRVTQLGIIATIMFGIVGGVVAIVIGSAMLKGRDWARMGFTVWGPIAFVLSILRSPAIKMRLGQLDNYPAEEVVTAGLVLGFVLLGAELYFLWRPPATAYFRPSAPTAASARVG